MKSRPSRAHALEVLEGEGLQERSKPSQGPLWLGTKPRLGPGAGGALEVLEGEGLQDRSKPSQGALWLGRAVAKGP